MAYNDKSLKKKKKSKSSGHGLNGLEQSDVNSVPMADSLSKLRLGNESPSSSSRRSLGSDPSSGTPTLTRKGKKKKHDEIEMGIKNVEMLDDNTTLHTVEVIKRPGQTLGFYIREGNGRSVKKGVFISRIAEGSIVQKNGLLKVGDEIQAINSVNVTRTNLDDVVVLMSIPKKLILTVKTSRQDHGNSSKAGYREAKPVYIHKTSLEEHDQQYADLNTEDSNDSGLSSEHSVRGERVEVNTYVDLPPPSSFGYKTLPAKTQVTQPEDHHVYSKPQPRTPRSDLYVSDGEHEYNPTPKLNSFQHTSSRKDKPERSYNQHYHSNSLDAYNSDSELIPKSYGEFGSNGSRHHNQWQHGHPPQPSPRRFISQENSNQSEPPYNGFSSEMQHWLRKFDSMSQELSVHHHSPSSRAESESAARELDGYQTELWRQEKLLNNAIHNMESALNVDAMLSQTSSANNQAYTLPRAATLTQAFINDGGLNQDVTTSYSYLRDLPLLMKTPMKIRIEDFELYRPEHERASANDILSEGTMKVKIYCGHGLKSTRTTLRDLYCVIQLDQVKIAKTMIRTGAINFDWDETFDMKVEDGTSNLICLIYHWDPHLRHRLCFTGTINLCNIFRRDVKETQNKRCALKLDPRGILYIEISYCPTLTEKESSNRLFGRSLKDTLIAEVTGTNVPLIVSKCVSEVNKRGLSVVGIYRLCGAAKKKQQLRYEFERHPHLVDLSPSNVPEIHAITGLLKDYLRELPDSLLTASAYRLVEKSLNQDVKQDSDQDSLEVVNAFVANLQPWQQGTVVFLFNHLKLISLHQSENRMTSSNLAVCFGPLFTHPTVEEDGDKESNETNSMRLHIEVIKYLLEIWPKNFSTNNNIVI